MDINDVNDLKQGVYEVFSEVYSNQVSFSALIMPTEYNFYNEEPNKDYSDPITFTAMVNLNPEAEEISLIGQTNFVNALFEVPIVCLEQGGLIDTSLKILKKGKITFQGTDYEIINIIPKSNTGEIFLTYSFECKGVEQ